jgi:uncharacterized protein (DUF305 family)
MQNTNNIFQSVVILAIGIFLGFLIWGGGFSSGRGEMHMMSNGEMMDGFMGMEEMMGNMTMELSGKTGNEFDRAFIEEMIVHHEGAVEMAEMALENAERAEIKTMANAIISAQTTEINQMKGWLQDWYGASASNN